MVARHSSQGSAGRALESFKLEVDASNANSYGLETRVVCGSVRESRLFESRQPD